jgi:uncharacterized protein
MLYLQDLTKQGLQHQKVTIEERLPSYISAPCSLSVAYRVEAKDNYYLIHLDVVAELIIICQRCMHDFNLNYTNQTRIAVARSEERAEQLLEQYECIVSSNWQVSLEDLVVDELHLYVPQFHQEIKDCDEDINQFLTEKNEPY